MWDIPVYRIRAYLRKRRQAEKLKGEMRADALHLRKVEAELLLTEVDGFLTKTIIHANVLFNDIHRKGMAIFLREPLEVGQSVSITLRQPTRFYVKGRVIGCHQVSHSRRVVSDTFCHYRAVIRYEFKSAQEVQAVAQYCGDTVYPMVEDPIVHPSKSLT